MISSEKTDRAAYKLVTAQKDLGRAFAEYIFYTNTDPVEAAEFLLKEISHQLKSLAGETSNG